MRQQLQTSPSAGADRRWLSMLLYTMDQVSDGELRGLPCDALVLEEVYAQLARPAGCIGPLWSASPTKSFTG